MGQSRTCMCSADVSGNLDMGSLFGSARIERIISGLAEATELKLEQ